MALGSFWRTLPEIRKPSPQPSTRREGCGIPVQADSSGELTVSGVQISEGTPVALQIQRP
ncbi:MAG: hypothetical protein OSB19_06985 [Opitutaceae bacterium]|nr:hypothetical protein [Opitutaceae bacterium]